MVKNSLSKEQKELIDRLMDAGIQKNTAKTLVFVAGREETKSREIENVTGLRQPEVSIAIQELRERDWVTKRDIKKEGKGRPVHGYRLNKDMNVVINEIEEKERERINEIEQNLKLVKKLASSI